jgi:ABC-2 type transport system ATP-binding protein
LQERTLGQSRVAVETSAPMPAEVPKLCEKMTMSDDRHKLELQSPNPARTIVELVKWIDQLGLELTDIQLKRPTLEDVFIELTGKRLRD